MARRALSTFMLVEALEAEGFPLPAGCREARLVMANDSAMLIQYDVFVTSDELAQLGRALQRLAGQPPQTDLKPST